MKSEVGAGVDPGRWRLGALRARLAPPSPEDEGALADLVDRLTVDRDQLPRFTLLLVLSVVVATFVVASAGSVILA